MWTSCGWVTPIIITVCVVTGVTHVDKLWLGDPPPIIIIVCVATGVIHVDKLWLGDHHHYNSVCCYRCDTCGQAVAG